MRVLYDSLVKRLKEVARLNGVMGIVYWDQEVIMPPGAAEARAMQISALAGVIHDKATAPEIGGWLQQLTQGQPNGFNYFELCNIREAKREYDRETKVPKALVEELAELSSRGHEIWVKARQQNRFADFAPVLQKSIELKKRWAAYIDPAMHPYDVNLDVYERGMTMAKLDPIFARLKEVLIDLVRAVQNSGYHPNESFMKGEFPVAKQTELGARISKDMGFSFAHGRMDVSVHPFCGGSHPTDVRITTRYRPDNFIESLYAVIHETGHGLYEQGRMPEGMDLPASEPLTMGVHESQSLFWERMIAQQKSFCAHYLNLFASYFPESLRGVTVDDLYAAINICRPSFIRVEADEVTYPLHVILRYELEKALFDGSIKVDDLPAVWNGKMAQYLGIRPATDAAGVLQDIHWSQGYFGYFPSYTLGAVYACQFYYALRRDIPDVEARIAAGRLLDIKTWLNEKVHRKGKLYSTDELLRDVTGEALNVDLYVRYLREKYKAIYKLH